MLARSSFSTVRRVFTDSGRRSSHRSEQEQKLVAVCCANVNVDFGIRCARLVKQVHNLTVDRKVFDGVENNFSLSLVRTLKGPGGTKGADHTVWFVACAV